MPSIYSSAPSKNPAKEKVFGIGLSKTGTSSLCKALQILGYSVVDFDVGLKLIDQYDAATDTPVAQAFDELDREYPGSKFIYTIRPRKAWLKSIERHWKLLRLVYPGQEADDLYYRIYGTKGCQFDATLFAAAYDRHEKRVFDYFKGRDLLVMDIREGWAPLCHFLGKPVPQTKFPRVNTKIGPLLHYRTRVRRLAKKLRKTLFEKPLQTLRPKRP